MRKSYIILQFFLLTVSAVSMMMSLSCANRGVGPQGGPKDSIGPEVVKTLPENGALNYTGTRIDIFCNEYLQLDNVSENLMISPPQQHLPEVKLVGKHLSLTFKDSLRENTTYTVDFGSAICDYREKNAMAGYTFSFATGNQIDTMSLCGWVRSAENLNPQVGVLVGIQDNLADSAFSTKPFTRVAKTDSIGFFQINNIRPGRYRVFALRDQSKDYLYQPGEPLAYLDTVLSFDDTYLMPDTVVAWLFAENKQRRYFQRCLRDERHLISLLFAAPQDSMPVLSAPWLDSTRIEMNSRMDTIRLWLVDSTLIQRDSLMLLMTYQKSDSLYNPEWVTDTIWPVYRQPNITEKARAELEKKAAKRLLTIKANAGAKFGANDTLTLRFDYPVDSLYEERMHLFEKKDTNYLPMAFKLLRQDSLGMKMQVVWRVQPEHNYEFRLDSAAFIDIYHHASDKQKFQMKVRSLEEYSTLRIKTPTYSEPLVLQLLDEKDQVVRTLPQTTEGAHFTFLEARIYYLRLFVDRNGDGRWTTGDWLHKQQAEPVFYFPKRLNLRANWDFEEDFDFQAIPAMESKPEAIMKAEDNKQKR